MSNSPSRRSLRSLQSALRALLGCAALSATLGGCQVYDRPLLSEMASAINATLEPDVIVLATGDQLEVRFPYTPTWNQLVEVGTDGSASFMAIGRLIVAGMSPGNLRQTLTEAYGRVFENPELDVVVRSLGARNVYIMGEVHEPGELALDTDRRLTLVEALARAGGPRKESAYLAHTLLIRWNASTGQQLTWEIDARSEHWGGAEPLYLQIYDVIYVPNTPVDNVAIWIDNYIRRMIPFPYLLGTSSSSG
jgi:protein involved in polysaccharide export with SLBB domain